MLIGRKRCHQQVNSRRQKKQKKIGGYVNYTTSDLCTDQEGLFLINVTDISNLTRTFITCRRCFYSNHVSQAFVVTGCLLHGSASHVRCDYHTDAVFPKSVTKLMLSNFLAPLLPTLVLSKVPQLRSSKDQHFQLQQLRSSTRAQAAPFPMMASTTDLGGPHFIPHLHPRNLWKEKRGAVCERALLGCTSTNRLQVKTCHLHFPACSLTLQ